jgi:hypothetical protein
MFSIEGGRIKSQRWHSPRANAMVARDAGLRGWRDKALRSGRH